MTNANTIGYRACRSKKPRRARPDLKSASAKAGPSWMRWRRCTRANWHASWSGEIMRYYDPTLHRRTATVAVQVERDLASASAKIRRRHAGDIAALAAE